VNRLFTLAIFLSATLLFIVQPLTGKILLPVLGGSPAVWSTCLVFFQAALLLGYLYAHVLTSRVPQRWQWPVHVCVLIAAATMLPLPIEVGEPGGADPRWWVLRTLVGTVGLPFFALSATAPLLQHWFSRTADPGARDPYFLYAASNAGSLLGLLAYLLVEPLATRSTQVIGWTMAFWAFAALVAACAYASVRCSVPWLPPSGGRAGAAVKLPANRPPPGLRRSAEALRAKAEAGSHEIDSPLSEPALWIALAFVPSALLLGVTQHLATDVVSAPLLWVMPLALYLSTFMAAFSRQGVGSARRWGTVAAVVAVLVLVLSLAEIRYPMVPVMLVHLAAFTALAMLCHTRLAGSRPDPTRLTEYFVCVSLGGVLGGAAAALVAPVLFSSILEYPLAIAAALLLRPQCVEADRMVKPRMAWRAAAAILVIAGYWSVSAFNEHADSTRVTSSAPFTWLRSLTGDAEIAQRVLRTSFAIPAVLLLLTPRTALLFAGTAAGLLVGAGVVRTGGRVLERERTFFGVHQVTSVQNDDWHVLTHGTTTHGVQATRGKVHFLPTAYYHPSGPIGDVVFTLVPDGRFRDVGVIGLGAGALAAYAGSHVRMDFFEIDEAVIRIAENPRLFTYLADARARPGVSVKTIAVDGRLGLRAMPEASYDLIVIDAFSSDAIPTHLITREAVAIYESRLKVRGMMAFHVSNRFFDLTPVLARIAAESGLVGYVRNEKEVPPEKAGEAMRPSVWVVLARDENDFGQIARSGPRWVRLAAAADDPLWTDDYTNVLGALAARGERRRAAAVRHRAVALKGTVTILGAFTREWWLSLFA
jgi:hypothetical protein